MNAPITRRTLLGATAAVGVAALPIAGSALSVSAAEVDADVELFVLLDRWQAVRAAWDASEAPFNAARERVKAAYPPRPDALQWRVGDFPGTSYGRGASDPVGDTGPREYGLRGVAWLQRARPSAQWSDEAEARRREIVEAHDAWMDARKVAEDATGYTAEVEAEVAAADVLNDVEHAVKVYQPRTVAGLVRKAVWVVDLLAREAGPDDLAEVFARQVAAFGGLADARCGPERPVTFDAAAFLADLKAARCRVTLGVPGTRFMGDELPTYFVAPSRGYTSVMAKWSDAIAACPDHVEMVTTRLAEMHGVEL